jgi:hypothetical protein
VNPQVVAHSTLAQQAQIVVAVVVIQKDRASIDSALGDV